MISTFNQGVRSNPKPAPTPPCTGSPVVKAKKPEYCSDGIIAGFIKPYTRKEKIKEVIQIYLNMEIDIPQVWIDEYNSSCREMVNNNENSK